MGKSKRQKSESKKLKKIKPSRKDMFSELKTFEENKINNSTQNKEQNLIHQPIEPEIDSEESIIPELEIESQINAQKLQKYKNVEKQWEFVNHLLAKNKINQKNAFDFQLISLVNLPEFSSSEPTDNAWKKMSSTLQNQYKIYSYKIDAIHTITYRILNTMTRNQQNPEEENLNHKKDSSESNSNGLFNFENDKNQGSITQLEKNINNINIDGIQYGCLFNPRFERTKKRFNQLGFYVLLLNSIEIDTNLELSLTGKRISEIDENKNQMSVKVDKMKQPLLILNQIEIVRKDSFRLIREDFSSVPLNIEEIWTNIGYGIWEQVENRQNVIEDFMDMEEDENMKKVEDVVKVSKKRKKINTNLQEISDFLKDNHWMSDYDRKILGLGGTIIKKSNSIFKNEDDIYFNLDFVPRGDIFTQQTIERQKNEFLQQIQEKHLLALRMFNKFKIEEIMSLREEPVEIYHGLIQDDQIIQQRMQIDMKRQQMSIRQTKDKMKALIKSEGNFNEIYKNFDKSDSQISPSLCFLTILHLANENNLQLQQDSDFNIYIR